MKGEEPADDVELKFGEKAPFEGVLVSPPNYQEFEDFYQEAQIRREIMQKPQPSYIDESFFSTKSVLLIIFGGAAALVIENQIH